MPPKSKPTSPRLAVAYRITHGTGNWTYACRRCRQRYVWPVESGTFREISIEDQNAIRAHAASHLIPQEARLS